MKTPLHTVLFFLALACMSAQPARAWQIEKHTDEMTDAGRKAEEILNATITKEDAEVRYKSENRLEQAKNL